MERGGGLDISSKHSKHAKKIVQGFRHGLYAGNVDFHVGDVSAWLESQKVTRQTEEPFLNHVFLDLPNADSHLANVAPALRVDGLLAVFNPSITQIAQCVEKIREEKLPYLLDQVVELGAGTIREWDVRAVRPRSTLKKADAKESSEASDAEPIDPVKGQEARDGELAETLAKEDEKWAMVCRPKAGQMVVGGGFLALWRRMERPKRKEQGEELPPPGKSESVTDNMDTEPDHGEESYVGTGKLKDRVAVITGGDSGIGRAVAIAYAREGADVAISYLPEEEEDAQVTAKLIRDAGRKALTLPGDIRDEAHCNRLVQRTHEEFGRLDILVNNAAFQMTHESITEITAEEFDRVFRTNVYARFYLCKAALPLMQPVASIIKRAAKPGITASLPARSFK